MVSVVESMVWAMVSPKGDARCHIAGTLECRVSQCRAAGVGWSPLDPGLLPVAAAAVCRF